MHSQVRSASTWSSTARSTDALAMAWRARDALGLDNDTRALIVDRLRRVANGPYWRYPTLRLNQINWYAEVYSAATTATSDPSYLQRDFRGQCCAHPQHPQPGEADTAGTLGPGMQFHYIPDGAPRVAAQCRLGRVREHRRVARTASTTAPSRRGMRPLPPEDEALLRRWMTRVLAGYWTHAGYLNWDTGFGFGRWHQMKKLGLAQQALIGMAAGGRLSPSRKESAWAKYILDRGFELYARLAAAGQGRRARACSIRSTTHPQSDKQAAARRRADRCANAARAAVAGLGTRPERRAAAAVRVRSRDRPPGGHDAPLQHRDHGRDARRVPVRRDRPRAAVRRPPGRRGDARRAPAVELRRRGAQHARHGPAGHGAAGQRLTAGRRPLRLLRAPWGVGSAGSPLRPFAGPFKRVRGHGPRARRGRRRPLDLHVPAASRSSATGRSGPRRDDARSAEVLFPSTGGDAAPPCGRCCAAAPSCRSAPGARVMGVRGFWVQSENSGYAVVPVDRVKGSIAAIIQPGAAGLGARSRADPHRPADRPAAQEAPGAVRGQDRDRARSRRRARGYPLTARTAALRAAGFGRVSRSAGAFCTHTGAEGAKGRAGAGRSPPPYNAAVRPSARQRGQHARDGVLERLAGAHHDLRRPRAARTARRRP